MMMITVTVFRVHFPNFSKHFTIYTHTPFLPHKLHRGKKKDAEFCVFGEGGVAVNTLILSLACHRKRSTQLQIQSANSRTLFIAETHPLNTKINMIVTCHHSSEIVIPYLASLLFLADSSHPCSLAVLISASTCTLSMRLRMYLKTCCFFFPLKFQMDVL